MNTISEYLSKPMFLRTCRRHHFLYHLSSLVMCLMVLVKMWTIISTWSSDSTIDWVMLGILLAAAEIMTMVHKAVIIPAWAVSKKEGGEA